MFKSLFIFIFLCPLVCQADFELPTEIDPAVAAITCACIGTTVTTLLVYKKIYAPFMLKRIRAQFATASTHTHNPGHMMQCLKQLHECNRGRSSLPIFNDIRHGKSTMFVCRQYKNYPLLQHTKDITRYLNHLEFARFAHLTNDDSSTYASLIESLYAIKSILSEQEEYLSARNNYAYAKEIHKIEEQTRQAQATAREAKQLAYTALEHADKNEIKRARELAREALQRASRIQ